MRVFGNSKYQVSAARRGLEAPGYGKCKPLKTGSPARFSRLASDVAGRFNARRAWLRHPRQLPNALQIDINTEIIAIVKGRIKAEKRQNSGRLRADRQ